MATASSGSRHEGAQSPNRRLSPLAAVLVTRLLLRLRTRLRGGHRSHLACGEVLLLQLRDLGRDLAQPRVSLPVRQLGRRLDLLTMKSIRAGLSTNTQPKPASLGGFRRLRTGAICRWKTLKTAGCGPRWRATGAHSALIEKHRGRLVSVVLVKHGVTASPRDQPPVERERENKGDYET